MPNFVALFTATMHHSHFKLGMVLLLGVLHVAYRIHIRKLSTSCFMTKTIFRHNMLKCKIFIALFSATMYYSHFKLGMFIPLGISIFPHSVRNQYFPFHFSQQPCITTSSNLIWCFGKGSWMLLTKCRSASYVLPVL